MPGRFDLEDADAYLRWRDRKLATAPRSADDLIVEVRNPRVLSPGEHAALTERIRRCNMAIYASPLHLEDTEIPRLLGQQFGLERLDANWLAADSLTDLSLNQIKRPALFRSGPYCFAAMMLRTSCRRRCPASSGTS